MYAGAGDFIIRMEKKDVAARSIEKSTVATSKSTGVISSKTQRLAASQPKSTRNSEPEK